MEISMFARPLGLMALLAASAAGAAPGGGADFRPPWQVIGDARVVAVAAAADVGRVQVLRAFEGPLCTTRLTNTGDAPVRLKEVILMEGAHALPASTPLYGEGFTMLSQTAGTLGKPLDVGAFTDRTHYRIPQPDDALTVYSLLAVSLPGGQESVLAFTSCRRFSGAFRLWADRYQVVLDTEGLELAPGETWELEELVAMRGTDRNDLLEQLGARIAVNHPPRRFREVPTGWCSWYRYGPGITAAQVLSNVDAIRRRVPELRYMQIDDGYQRAMGDWLDVRAGFGMEMEPLCKRIADAGLEPAVWVAPFVAEEKSRVFQEHPEWFVQDDAGRPLRSDRVSFGGWRSGPWYVLDGTHPEVQRHFESTFRTMRERWGCTYFKLDANFWGTLHGGRHHDRAATRVEAYRRGMEAILRGAGDSFVLGCNHPMWPSLGLIDGSRASMDIAPRRESVFTTGRECFLRNWQHQRLWLNDPDVVMLGDYHALDDLETRMSIVLATGGLVMSGDDMASLSDDRVQMLRKLVGAIGPAARFHDDSLTFATLEREDRHLLFLFNWHIHPQSMQFGLLERCRVADFWSGRDLGVQAEQYWLARIESHAARVLVCERAATRGE